MNTKKILVRIFLISIILLGINNTSNAVLESRSGVESWKAGIGSVVPGIRQMEKSGETLGLNAQIQGGTNLENSESKNGLDVHLSRLTEWGTVALLAVSDYGAYGQLVEDDGSDCSAVTGNVTGVFQMSDMTDEWVAYNFAGTFYGSENGLIQSDERYYDKASSVEHPGAAYYETAGWFGSDNPATQVNFYNPYLKRGMESLFKVTVVQNSRGSEAARACITCGEGL